MELSELTPGMKVLFHDEEIKYIGKMDFSYIALMRMV